MTCDRCGHEPGRHRAAGSAQRSCALCSCRRTQWYLAKMEDGDGRRTSITVRVDDEVLRLIRERQAELQSGSARNVSVSEALADLLRAPEASPA